MCWFYHIPLPFLRRTWPTPKTGVSKASQLPSHCVLLSSAVPTCLIIHSTQLQFSIPIIAAEPQWFRGGQASLLLDNANDYSRTSRVDPEGRTPGSDGEARLTLLSFVTEICAAFAMLQPKTSTCLLL